MSDAEQKTPQGGDGAKVPRADDETVPASAGSRPSDDGPVSALGGGTIGPYRLLRELGRGGQGFVYLAEDIRLSRRVALKVISPQFTPTTGTIARFHREAENASRLDHPGICAVFEAGEADGFHYIAMRYVEGTTLAERIDEARSAAPTERRTSLVPRSEEEPDAAARVPTSGGDHEGPAQKLSSNAPTSREQIFAVIVLIERVARALHVAHESGLIHRDIKPGNIMVTPEGDPVVLDFGLAREVEGQGLTVSGDLLGTPAYMSPEQIAASRIPLDRRTDIYSLGVTLYECLTLERPFDAPTREGIYQQILASDPPDPRRRNEHVPWDLCVVLETALEKDRDRRYKTAFDFAEDLRRVRTFEPIQARPAGPLLRFQRWIQRNPVAATATLALFLFLTIGLVISLSLLSRVQREKEAKDDALAEKEAALLEKDNALLEREQALTEKVDALARLRDAMRAAEEERDKAEGLYLAGRASNVLRRNPSQAMLLALEASERYRGPLLGDVLLEALRRQREESVFLDYGRSIRLARWSPDGKRLATVSSDGVVRIRDGASGESLHLLADPRGGVIVDIDFDPAGRFLVGATIGRAVLWDARQGATVAVLEGHVEQHPLTVVRFSPDGRRIVTGSIDGTARVWGTAAASEVAVLEGHECAILSAEFSPDGERLLTASSGFLHVIARDTQGRVIGRGFASAKPGPTTARVWDAASGRELLKLGGHIGPLELAVWSRDGDRVLTVSSAGARIHRADTGELIGEVKRSPSAPPLDVSRPSPDGRRFLLLDREGELSVRDASSGEEVARLRVGRPEALAPPPAFDREGSRLAIAGPDDGVGIWSVDSGEKLLTLRGHEGDVRSMEFHPRDGRLLTSASDGTTRIWDSSTERGLGDLLARDAAVRLSRFSSDGRRAVVEFQDGERRVISCPDGDLVTRFEPERPSFSLYSREPIEFALFAEDGRLLTASRSTLRLWDPAGKTLVAATSLHGAGLDVSSDGETVAFIGPDGKLSVVSLKKGRLFEAGEARTGRLRERFSAVRFLAGGREVMALSSRPSLCVWEVPGGDELRRLELGAHFDGVPDLVGLDAEGRRLVLHHDGGPVKMLDATSGEALASFGSYPEGVLHAGIDRRSGRLLVVTPPAVEIRDVAGGLVASISAGDEAFAAGTFGPEGRKVLTLDRAGEAEIRDADDGTRLLGLDPGAPVRSASFSPDGGRILAVAGPRTIVLLDAGSGRRIFSSDDHPADVVTAIFDGEGAVALAVTEDGTLHPWDALTGEKLDVIEKAVLGPQGRTYFSPRFTFSADGQRLLETSLSRWQAGMAWVRDVRSGDVILELGESRPPVDLVEISPDGKAVLVGRKERLPPLARRLEDVQARRRGTALAARDVLELKLVDIADGRARVVLESPGAFPERVEFSPRGDVIAGMTGSEVIVWDVSTGRLLGRLGVTSPETVRFAPDGRRMLVLTSLGDPVPARLWDIDAEETVELRAAVSPTAGAFTPGGRRVVIGSSDGSLLVFDAETGELARTLFAHAKAIHDVAFSPEGRWLGSGSEDGTARVRNATDGVEELVFPHAEAVTAVGFTADGSRLLTIEDDGTPHAWPLDLVGLARERKVRELTPDERDRFEVGSPAEREAYRREWEERVLCELIDETGGALAAEPSNLHVLALARARVASLSSLGGTGESEPRPIDCLEAVFRRHDLENPAFLTFRSELRLRSGDLRGAIIGLEEVSRRFGEEPGRERQLELWRRRALPDLVSYSSIDAALERGEALIAEGDEWRFFRGRREPTSAFEWTRPDFDDGGWESGPSGLGYGDGDDATLLEDMRGSYTTVYLRRRFTISDIRNVTGLTLAVRVDDGLVAYLNGSEVFRMNAPGIEGEALGFRAVATRVATEPLTTLSAEIDPALLRPDSNVLAIHALNRNTTSSDLTVVPELRVSRRPDVARDRQRFAVFLRRARGEDAPRRIAYLEGRLRERAGRFTEAIPFFEEVLAEDPSAIEPLLSLANCLRRSGDAPAALSVLTRALDAALESMRGAILSRLWRLWFATYVVDLGRNPREALAFLRRRGSGEASLPGGDYGWVLRELVERGAVRIVCGRSESYRDADGKHWSSDRFFVGGVPGQRGGRREREDGVPLRDTERYFVPRGSGRFLGYRIPLPPGRYRLDLHFAEFHFTAVRERVFDVLVEGRKVLDDYDPFVAAGPDGVDVRTVDVTVDDGFLEIRFMAEVENPKVTAIEIRPAE